MNQNYRYSCSFARVLAEYEPLANPYNPYLFPSREGKPLKGKPLTRFMADKILRAACRRIGFESVKLRLL